MGSSGRRTPRGRAAGGLGALPGVLLAVVLGLLAMHGLTADHQLPAAAATAGHGQHAAGVPSTVDHAGHAASAAAAGPAGVVALLLPAPAGEHSGHAMAGSCLAVLAASLLLLVLLLSAADRPRGGRLENRPRDPRLRLPRGSPPTHLRPTLGRLCVLRT